MSQRGGATNKRYVFFETKILRRIIGPVCDRGRWKRRVNSKIYKDPPVRRIIKSARSKEWYTCPFVGESEIPQKVLLEYLG